MQAVHGAEAHGRTQQTALEHLRRVGARVVSDQQRLTIDHIVDDLVPDEESQGIGAGVRANGKRNDRFARIEEGIGVFDILEDRHFNRFGAIAFEIAGVQLREGDTGDPEIGGPLLDAPLSGTLQVR